MVNEEYVELYKKSPKDILNYVIEDMLKILAYTNLDDNTSDKIGEWRYILMRAERKIINN